MRVRLWALLPDGPFRGAKSAGARRRHPEPFSEQLHPTFTREIFSLKLSLGSGGFRRTTERIPFLNSLFSALLAISGFAAQESLCY